MSEEDANKLDYLTYITGKSKTDVIMEALKFYNDVVKYQK